MAALAGGDRDAVVWNRGAAAGGSLVLVLGIVACRAIVRRLKQLRKMMEDSQKQIQEPMEQELKNPLAFSFSWSSRSNSVEGNICGSAEETRGREQREDTNGDNDRKAMELVVNIWAALQYCGLLSLSVFFASYIGPFNRELAILRDTASRAR